MGDCLCAGVPSRPSYLEETYKPNDNRGKQPEYWESLSLVVCISEVFGSSPLAVALVGKEREEDLHRQGHAPGKGMRHTWRDTRQAHMRPHSSRPHKHTHLLNGETVCFHMDGMVQDEPYTAG